MITEAILTKEKAVIPYVTAGLPDLDTTGEILKVLDEAGAAAIEIGIPFSDPWRMDPCSRRPPMLLCRRGSLWIGCYRDWRSGADRYGRL